LRYTGYDDGMQNNGTHDGSADDEALLEHDPTVFYSPEDDPTGVDSGHRVAGAFRYALVIVGGPTSGLAYVLGDGETVAGRSDDSDIFLGDVTVSRQHARFVVDESGLSVTDAGSTNGTYVNLERVAQTVLRPGDEVIIGKFHLRVTAGSAEG